MEKIIFVNSKGVSIQIGDTAPFILYKIEGTGGSKADIQMNKSPFQQGKTYIDTLMDYRTLSLEIVILAKDEMEQFERRKQLNSIFNPLLKEGTLTYQYDGGEKSIGVVMESSPIFKDSPENPLGQLHCLITLYAPSPFWLDTFIEGEELSYLMGGFQFGLKIPTTFSYRGKKKKVINIGDVDTPVTIEFYGPGANPTIRNETTGEFIKVRKELLEGEILRIDTSFGNKKVEIERLDGSTENAFGYIDLDSVFWSLNSGENILSYESLNDSQKTKVKITFKNRYIGV